MESTNRLYHRRRSLDEIQAAMRAERIEAAKAHFQLAELHLRCCATCVSEATDECGQCLMTHICYRDDMREQDSELAIVTVERQASRQKVQSGRLPDYVCEPQDAAPVLKIVEVLG